MPVNILYCEGAERSPDVRLLSKLLSGYCEVRPHGGKHGMKNWVLSVREARKNPNIYALLDRDFTNDWSDPSDEPHVWVENDHDNKKIHLGWRWDRKEIENYLVDPVVVEQALGIQNISIDIEKYTEALGKARDELAIYQAARITLSSCRRKFKHLPSGLGKNRGKHKYQYPEDFSEKYCRKELKNRIGDFNKSRAVDWSDAEKLFEKFLAECQTGGCRYENYLYSFAGKDILWYLDDNYFKYAGIEKINRMDKFSEKITKGVDAANNPTEWLMEWQNLRDLIVSF